MKKQILLTAFMLSCFLAFSQEASESGHSTEFHIVGRGEYDVLNNNFYNSALYSLFEGSISDNLSFSVLCHWLNCEDNADLYKATLRSDSANWLNWAYLDYRIGNWGFRAGKDFAALGSFDLDPYDYDVDYTLATRFWNDIQSYQWGASVSWFDNSESNQLTLNVSTSPFGERPFASGLYGVSLLWRGEFGPFSTIWSTNTFDTGQGNAQSIIALGNKFSFDSVEITLDLINDALTGTNGYFNQNFHAVASVQYMGDRLEAGIKGLLDRCLGSNVFYGGPFVHFFPIKNSKSLRLHAAWCASSDKSEEAYHPSSLIFGLTYDLDVLNLFRK